MKTRQRIMLSIPVHGLELSLAHPKTDIVPVTLPFAEPLSNDKSLLANQISHEMLGIPSRDPSPSPRFINRRENLVKWKSTHVFHEVYDQTDSCIISTWEVASTKFQCLNTLRVYSVTKPLSNKGKVEMLAVNLISASRAVAREMIEVRTHSREMKWDLHSCGLSFTCAIHLHSVGIYSGIVTQENNLHQASMNTWP